MKIEKINGLWVPNNDLHIESWKSGQSFTQNKCLNNFIAYCKTNNIKFNNVLDIGAWVGTWSLAINEFCTKVIAFEPDKLHYECLVKNVPDNVETHQLAVGSENKKISLDDNTHTQAKRVIGEGDIPMTTIDSLKLSADLIKIDVEGYEMEVLKGADKTLETPQYIMIELNSNTERYGFTSLEVAKYLVNKGFDVLLEHWPDKVFIKK